MTFLTLEEPKHQKTSIKKLLSLKPFNVRIKRDSQYVEDLFWKCHSNYRLQYSRMLRGFTPVLHIHLLSNDLTYLL